MFFRTQLLCGSKLVISTACGFNKMRFDTALLQRVDLFLGIEQAVLDELSEQSFVLEVPQRIVVIKQNHTIDALRVIIEGKAIAVCHHGVRSAAMGLLTAGDSFLWESLIDGHAASVSVQTVQDCKLLVIPLQVLNQLIHSNYSFCENVMRHQACYNERQIKIIKGLKLRSATERLAAWILENATHTNSRDRVDLPIEKQLLASELAMTPENLARALNTLTAHGITLEGKRIWISNKTALQKLASPTAGIDCPLSKAVGLDDFERM
jgi:CRP/FNR family transcriptional activator FtrB